MDSFVEKTVAKAIAGEALSDEELLPLFDLGTFSAEAAHVEWAAGVIARKASGGRGLIYAQIGVDCLPCPMDCAFCGLARCNAAEDVLQAEPEELIVPTEQVAEYARVFDEAGVHLISLMATAALPFERYLEIVRAVRAAVQDDQVILANYGDLSLRQAQELKEAGAGMAYHAHRLGEGEITRIPGATRIRTLENIRAAGMKIMTSVEPVREGVPAELILERMHECAGFEPYCSGVGTLTAVPGTAMEHEVPVSRARLRLYSSIFRLMVGEGIPFGTGAGNIMWTDAGTNPRGRNLPTDPDFLRRDVRRIRKTLRGQEWFVPDRPI